MSRLKIYAGQRVDTITRRIGDYLGFNGLVYPVAARLTVNVTEQLFFSAGAAPVVESEIRSPSTQGSVQGMGVILNSVGEELFRFYPQDNINPATPSGS